MAPAAGWERVHIPAVPIVAARVAAVAAAVVPTAVVQVAAAVVAVVPTAVVLPEEHFEVPGSVPIAVGQVGARGTEQAEAASTAAASLAQAVTEQLVPG